MTQKPLKAVLPRYILRCQQEAWTLELEHKKSGIKTHVCYKCGSWRCVGECARRNAATLFARLKASVDRVPDFWVFLTLTLNPKRYKSREAMYACASSSWAKFRKRLKKDFGYDHFFLVFEVSARAGALHIHAIVRSKRLHSALLRDGPETHWKAWLKPVAVESGFGFKCHWDSVRDADAMSGYLVKSSGINGELTHAETKGQLPVDAPQGFRRVRSSKGFLVPKVKSETLTGRLITRRLSDVLSRESAIQGVETHIRINADECRARLDRIQALEDRSRKFSGVTGYLPGFYQFTQLVESAVVSKTRARRRSIVLAALLSGGP